MKKLSLRLRLTLSFIFIASIIWVMAAFLSWKESREEIYEFFDSYQLLLARQLSTADWSNITPNSQKISNKIIDSVDADDEDEAIGFAVFDAQGKMIFNDDKNGANFTYQNGDGSFINQPIIGEDETWRIVRIKSADSKFTIAVGQELEYRDEIAMDLVEETLLPWLVGLTLLMLATIVMVSLEFSPLKKLTKDLGKRDANDLLPLSKQDMPKEITPLIEAINRLFIQIENMIKRERHFISDSAHELRSPLTALKVQLEVAQMAKDDEKVRDNALAKLEIGIERSSRLVEQLLALSRIESSICNSENAETINWESLVKQAIEEHKSAALKKDINIVSNVKDTSIINEGNNILWSLLLRNLLDNAIRYSPSKAHISINVSQDKIEVINSDTIVDEKNLSHLSERFYRPSGQKENGSGLGLSIVDRIAKIYNCQLSFENTPEGFCVRVYKLPV